MRLGEKRYGWPTILSLATNDNKERRLATFVRTLISCSVVDMLERTEDWKEGRRMTHWQPPPPPPPSLHCTTAANLQSLQGTNNLENKNQ